MLQNKYDVSEVEPVGVLYAPVIGRLFTCTTNSFRRKTVPISPAVFPCIRVRSWLRSMQPYTQTTYVRKREGPLSVLSSVG